MSRNPDLTLFIHTPFREDMRFAESIGYEMGAEEEQDNNAY